ncbi:hypothetical protein HBI23_246780 [Parastagonospora nodorum]|nr:hypothetical protein HBI23_246780 [Parastagonospora nodorum]KAH5622263.1 hypothetical protein HBI51_247660 [Parastagonospora nodorum]KAH6134180.1 hypothetical protein HBI68_248670 [Parastagonospora nodorum]KAH6383985.1 hypothetical protein HBI60_251600 [Parastagonospora nodorum]
MQFLSSFAIPLFFTASTLVTARGSQVTITILNEIDRQSGAAAIPADGRSRRVPDLFINTGINCNGQFLGTSAKLTSLADDAHCLIRGNTGGVFLNNSIPLLDLDGNSNAALIEPLSLDNFRVRCWT